jgi:hypothetical protein
VAEWTRIVNTTIHDYLREVEVNVLRNRKLLALLQSRGRISMDHAGDVLDWKIRYKRVPIQGYADMDSLTFSRKNRWQTAQLDVRGYAATDMMVKRERLINKSTEAIVKVWGEMAGNLMEDLEDQFGDEMYQDGNASGKTKGIHGLESWYGDTNSEASAGYIYPPSDTYAGLVTTLGNYGGNWSTNGSSQVEWPTGTGDAHYDFWSPLVVKVTSNSWAATTKTWANTCTEALRYGLIKGRRNKSKRGMIDLVLMDNDWYRQLEEKIESKERLVISRGEPLGLVALGYKDSIQYEGVETTWEYGTPTNTAYGIPIESLELMSWQKSLFVPEGPDFDISTQAYRISFDFFGNLKNASPRGWVKWRT